MCFDLFKRIIMVCRQWRRELQFPSHLGNDVCFPLCKRTLSAWHPCRLHSSGGRLFPTSSVTLQTKQVENLPIQLGSLWLRLTATTRVPYDSTRIHLVVMCTDTQYQRPLFRGVAHSYSFYHRAQPCLSSSLASQTSFSKNQLRKETEKSSLKKIFTSVASRLRLIRRTV